MNAKQAVSEIKALLGQFGLVSNPKASFKTEDNTIYQAEKIEAGYSINKINDKFEEVSVENGSYKTNDGKIVDVQDSKIVAVKEAFLDAKLADGTQIKVEGDSLAEGAKVVVVTEDALVPAPDGRHELEDGTIVETKDGLIAKIEQKAEVEAETVVEDAPLDGAGGDPELIELVKLMKDMVSKMEEKMGNMKKKMESMESDFEAFKKQPAGKKISDGKTDFNKLIEGSDDDVVASNIMKLRYSK